MFGDSVAASISFFTVSVWSMAKGEVGVTGHTHAPAKSCARDTTGAFAANELMMPMPICQSNPNGRSTGSIQRPM